VRDVVVLDWGGGNVGSVLRALARAGVEPSLSADPARVGEAERLVFPGVGAFGHVIARLEAGGFTAPLLERIRSGRLPTLAICVGLQALYERSEEADASVRGLALLPGSLVRLRARKVPHVGWNEVVPSRADDPHLARGHAYFVHSYAAPAEGPHLAAATEHEGERFASALRLGPTLALQFHPEKSGAFGAALIERWLAHPEGG
jgi:glutamine amidotransferase